MNIKLISVIETSSICNLKCEYCPCEKSKKHRNTGVMTIQTFVKAIEWVKYYERKGAYREHNDATLVDINLHGIGECLLNPHIVDMVRYAVKTIPQVKFRLCTNGILLTEKLCSQLAKAGLYSLEITDHNAKVTARVLSFRERYFANGNVARGFATLPHDWAGQVKWYKSWEEWECLHLKYGLGVILWDGSITTCCLDAFNINVFGHIDQDISLLEMKSGELCKTCHYTIN